ncbi:MAG: sigma factor-like helix-turn-helix DNA-binding protein [Paeniclostridium sordellii]|nr:sigma factor-like helix-turn-helix DNA-binding protein [Paeniclostridium sordellii]
MKEIIGEINKRLDELKEIDKEIFRERFENESKVKDISNKIGITPKAISLRIMRIKKFLKDINRG